MFRFSQNTYDKGLVWQDRHVPFLIEMGRQWSVSALWLDRIAANPRRLDNDSVASKMKWRRWWFPWWEGEDLSEGEWRFSLFYLRGDAVVPPEFFCRTTLGVTIGFGTEFRGMSVGFSESAELTARDHQFYAFQFSKGSPLQTRFLVAGQGQDVLTALERRHE
jgi:hypothetical protein